MVAAGSLTTVWSPAFFPPAHLSAAALRGLIEGLSLFSLSSLLGLFFWELIIFLAFPICSHCMLMVKPKLKCFKLQLFNDHYTNIWLYSNEWKKTPSQFLPQMQRHLPSSALEADFTCYNEHHDGDFGKEIEILRLEENYSLVHVCLIDTCRADHTLQSRLQFFNFVKKIS